MNMIQSSNEIKKKVLYVMCAPKYLDRMAPNKLFIA